MKVDCFIMLNPTQQWQSGGKYTSEKGHTQTQVGYTTLLQQMSKVKNQSPLGKFAKSCHIQNFCLHENKSR